MCLPTASTPRIVPLMAANTSPFAIDPLEAEPVASAETLPPPSRRFAQAALAEGNRVRRQLERLDEHAASLRRELSAIEQRRAELQGQLDLLERVSEQPRRLEIVAAAAPAPPPGPLLRGAQL